MRTPLLLSILLAVAVACSQSLTPDKTGTGGRETGEGGGDGGSGPGIGGMGGTVSGTGGVVPAICDTLTAEYRSAVVAAQACQVGASGQCQQIVSGNLTGCSCPTYVTDGAALSAIEDAWQADGCAMPTAPCRILCPAALNTTCVATDGGTSGVCSYVFGTGGTTGAGGDGAPGTGGTPGTGGITGAGGAAVDGGLADCSTLVSEYAAVLIGARSCTAGAAGQCGQAVPSALSPCNGGCTELVTDSSVLDTIQRRWEMAGCGNVDVACPLIACAPAVSAACVPSDAGGSVCATSYGTFIGG